MVTVFIVLLVISQVICFYFFILLNTKIAKFNDLEVRQDRLIREMDDTIAAYLLEMKEENDRLIQELSNINQSVELKNENLGTMNNNANEQKPTQQGTMQEEIEIKLEPKTLIPKNIATNAYNRQKKHVQQDQSEKIAEKKVASDKSDSFESQVITLHSEGKSIEEIAKITQKGKTEIELLLKFHG